MWFRSRLRLLCGFRVSRRRIYPAVARRWSRTTSAGKYGVEHSALIFETRAIGLPVGHWGLVWSVEC